MKRLKRMPAFSGRPASTIYFYRLQGEDFSAKVVKSFAWDISLPLSQIPFDRQFFVSLRRSRARTKRSSCLVRWRPSHVVDAMKAGTKTEKTSANTVIINKRLSIWTDPSGSGRVGIQRLSGPEDVPKDRPANASDCKQDGDT